MKTKATLVFSISQSVTWGFSINRGFFINRRLFYKPPALSLEMLYHLPALCNPLALLCNTMVINIIIFNEKKKRSPK
ncbi:hypothetical protein EUTSA_v10019403mg [Eutrema salsugineum]|uniref:Uncharacterized protein n=1 Tax=Eutrema salsugineum TaxID=72664 RepID=V4KFZ4_EUTSA|nr:hypothetical protein EUTSA_v10019403mg [Eutrema salsugineum]